MRGRFFQFSLFVLLALSSCRTPTAVLLEGAQQGDAAMQYRYAYRLLESRDEGELYRQRALEWFHASARQQYAPAQMAMGALYHTGLTGTQDEKLARFWYEKALAQGDNNACRGLLSLALAKDDWAEAAPYLKRLAIAGDVECSLKYAAMLMEGRGVPRDEAAAVDYWRYAAMAGNAHGCLMMGTCYANGWGVPIVPRLANFWWGRAREN